MLGSLSWIVVVFVCLVGSFGLFGLNRLYFVCVYMLVWFACLLSYFAILGLGLLVFGLFWACVCCLFWFDVVFGCCLIWVCFLLFWV